MIIIALALFWSAVRGLCEAMTMHLPNPREHPWFAWYHAGRVLEAAALAALAVLLWQFAGDHIADISKMIYMFTGLALIAWEAFELSYFAGRLGQAALGHENVLGIWSVDSLLRVGLFHAGRILTGVICITKGGIL